LACIASTHQVCAVMAEYGYHKLAKATLCPFESRM
jgi:hypothetical protein